MLYKTIGLLWYKKNPDWFLEFIFFIFFSNSVLKFPILAIWLTIFIFEYVLIFFLPNTDYLGVSYFMVYFYLSFFLFL